MFGLLKRLFGKKSPPPYVPHVETPEEKHGRQRDNAIVYTAQKVARVSLARGDVTGAILDMQRILHLYGWDAFWLPFAVADAFKTGARGFVEGFSCDHEAAEKWLETNELKAA